MRGHSSLLQQSGDLAGDSVAVDPLVLDHRLLDLVERRDLIREMYDHLLRVIRLEDLDGHPIVNDIPLHLLPDKIPDGVLEQWLLEVGLYVLQQVPLVPLAVTHLSEDLSVFREDTFNSHT